MRHAVIMAGGSGTRLWPLSRASTPKQFQKLVGQTTLLQQTFERIEKIIPSERIWIVTNQHYRQLVEEQLPTIPKQHIITEPFGRNTAAATLLATMAVLEEDSGAILFGLLPADHYVGKPKVFRAATETLLSFIENNPEYVATIGIRPTEPNTGLGYIKLGTSLAKLNRRAIFKVDSFHEKPKLEVAEEFVASGEYLWNGGYYLFNGQTMLGYFQQLAPEIYKKVGNYRQQQSPEAYEKIPAESIDTAIAEKLPYLAVVPAEMDWSDVGNWAALHEILSAEGKTSEVVVGDHISEQSENTLVMGGGKLIVTVGVKDIVVIDTDDVILICQKGSVQEVKKIVERLQKQGREEYL